MDNVRFFFNPYNNFTDCHAALQTAGLIFAIGADCIRCTQSLDHIFSLGQNLADSVLACHPWLCVLEGKMYESLLGGEKCKFYCSAS